MSDVTEEPVEKRTGGPPRGGGGRDERLESVAQAAVRAFELLPAGPGPDPDGSPQRRRPGGLPHRIETDRDTVERDLMKLVLTLVELLRQLMERTALHRADQGDLSPEQEERIGSTLMLLEDRMAGLCEEHGVDPADLNLDLGPLGSLLPTGPEQRDLGP